ncbi:MAG: hypothetical protein AAGJ79_15230 [Verrucomicrobiota bacterium]
MSNRRRPTRTRRWAALSGLLVITFAAGIAISHSFRSPVDEMTVPLNGAATSSSTEESTARPPRLSAPAVETTAGLQMPPANEAALTFERLAFLDPDAAARAVAGLDESVERDEKLMILLETWVDTSPVTAADWSAELPVGSFRSEALARVANLWAHDDRDEARRWLEAQQPPAHFLPAWGAFAMVWASDEPEKAIDWTREIPDPAARERAEAGVARQLATTNPQMAREWLSSITTPADFDRLATHFVTAWAAEDPDATADWLKTGLILNNEEFRRKAALLLAVHWTATDPTAAGNWINQLEDGSLRENAKYAFAQSLAAEEPEIALAWADSLEDQEDRRDTVLTIYEDWLDADPNAFKTGLVERWADYAEDPAMRQDIYEILYQSDEDFRKEVFSLLEGFIYPDPEEAAAAEDAPNA